MRDCVNLRSLPKVLAFFPLKHIQLYNSGHLIKNETNLPKSLVNFVLIDWYYGNFDFNNIGKRRRNLDFDLIIDRLTLVYECLETNVLTALIMNFRRKKNQIIGCWSNELKKNPIKNLKRSFMILSIKSPRKLKSLKENYFYNLNKIYNSKPKM